MSAEAAFVIGDRVRVGGGYEQEPEWLAGGVGYSGTIIDIHGSWAVVELDVDLDLAASGQSDGWADFGRGSATQQGVTPLARGRWLALALGWVGAEWREPIARLHVGLCSERPDLRSVPEGGGIGAWVESSGW